MYTVLLSGGSGKRLWPLSNDLRSKQYLKLITREGEDAPCSMVQRVWAQLGHAGLDSRLICASAGQVEIIRGQLGDVPIAVEPDRRDTFPAVSLSCAHIHSLLGGSPEDIVCVLPVDPYTEASYFKTLGRLEAVLTQSGADIALMGAVPDNPSDKYGYILPGKARDGYVEVRGFREKPDLEAAQALIGQGALWNCGVFCFRLGLMLDRLAYYGAPADYDALYARYDALPKISFDYEILEKAESLVAVPYHGMWTDLGSWSSLTQRMTTPTLGKVKLSSCGDTYVVNELDLPVIALGVQNVVVVAAWDGILVADLTAADRIKEVAGDMHLKAMYEERRWGTIKTVDIAENSDGFVLTRKILMFGGQFSSYHFHAEREEAVTILRGRGELMVEGVSTTVSQGTTITIPRGKRHGFRAFEDMEFMEIHIGRTMGDADINRLTFDWAQISAIEKGMDK